MGTKLYVGNLPYSTNEEALKEKFSEFGDVVSAKIIMDKFSGRSKGFGFVEFADADAAQKAMEAMNGAEFDGRELVVNEARPEKPRDDRNAGGAY